MADIFDEAGGDIFDEVSPELQEPELQQAHTPALEQREDLGAGVGVMPPEEKSYLQETGEKAGAMGSGMYGRTLGAMQLGAEAVEAVTPEGTGEMAVEYWRGKEEERRGVMDELKAEYGEKGVANPISRAEFAGEMAPEIVGGAALGAEALASRGLPLNYLKTAAKGAGLGAASGSTMNLTAEESRLETTLFGAAIGGVAGPVGKALVEKTPGLVKALNRKRITAIERNALKKSDPEAYKLMTGAEGAMETNLRVIAPRTAKKKTPMRVYAQQVKNDNAAVKDLALRRNEMTFKRDGQEVTDEFPETMEEFVEAMDNAMILKMDVMEEGLQAAGSQGQRVDINPVVSALRKVVNDVGGTPADIRAYAATQLKEFEPLAAHGGLSPGQAARRMKAYNNKLDAVYEGQNVAGENKEVLLGITNNLRVSLNDMMDGMTDSQFSGLRREWGNLRDLQGRAKMTSERLKTREAKPSMSVFDILSIEQLIRGDFLHAAGSKSADLAARKWRSPNRAVKNMFRTANHLTKGKTPEPYNVPRTIEGPRQPMIKDPSTGKVVPARVPARPRTPTALGATEPAAPYVDTRPRIPVAGSSPTTKIHELPAPAKGQKVRKKIDIDGKQVEIYFDRTVGRWLPAKG